MKKGKVYLVGAGPGDPGLITVRGLECLAQADVVIYDRLLDNRLLDALRPGVKKIYAGKTPRHHTTEQPEINRLLVDEAKGGKVVVRLKGGDPFVFGRGGEEAEALARNNIPFEVVPGVTAAVAVPAYAGIPVTHRGMASSFSVVTGHAAADRDIESISWGNIAASTGTLVFLMGVQKLGRIVGKLVENGKPETIPAALIANGTSPSQRTITGTLGTIVSQAEQANIGPPAILVVGDVVNLRKAINWFDRLPLFGKRVLVTRPKHQAGQLSRLLAEGGAIPVEFPSIKIWPALSTDGLDEAIRNLNDYNWVIFTSVNGVESFFRCLQALSLDSRHLHNNRIGAIGPATAKALENRGINADFIPKRYTSRGILAGLRKLDLAGCRVLLPRADIAGRELADGVSSLGAEVHEVVAYRTLPDTRSIAKVRRMLKNKEIDVVAFTSSSTVTSLVEALGDDRKLISNALVACIGPVTKAAASRAGLKTDIMVSKHTIPGLTEAIEQHFRKE